MHAIIYVCALMIAGRAAEPLKITEIAARRIAREFREPTKIIIAPKVILELSGSDSLNVVSFLKLVYAAACINKLMLTGKERMALIADVHL